MKLRAQLGGSTLPRGGVEGQKGEQGLPTLLHCSSEQGAEREGSWEGRDAAAGKLGSQGMLHCRAEIRSCANGDVLVSGRV